MARLRRAYELSESLTVIAYSVGRTLSTSDGPDLTSSVPFTPARWAQSEVVSVIGSDEVDYRGAHGWQNERQRRMSARLEMVEVFRRCKNVDAVASFLRKMLYVSCDQPGSRSVSQREKRQIAQIRQLSRPPNCRIR